MLTELENLLHHAGMPDLADRVCVWSTANILAAAKLRPSWNVNLATWQSRWEKCETIADMED